MNDLISRTAVLRLLDENCVVFRGEIEKMPGVDAIPVEWLEAQIFPYHDNLKDGVKGVFNATIREMIYRWRQEQEVQDG